MRMVRSRAATDGFDPNKIVVIGSSAGGHLAATLMTRFDQGNLDDPDPVDGTSVFSLAYMGGWSRAYREYVAVRASAQAGAGAV